MEDDAKTREQLVNELRELRSQISVLAGRWRQDKLKLAALDNSPFSLWASTRECRIVLWTKQAEKIYGYAEHDVLGKDFVCLFVDPPEQADARADCARIVDGNIVFRNFLAYDQRRDGTRLRMLTNCFRIWDEETSQYLQAEVGLEISDLGESEERHRSLREFGLQQLAMKDRYFDLERKQMLASIAMAMHRHLSDIDKIRRLNEDYITELMREKKYTREAAERVVKGPLELLHAQTKRLQDTQEALHQSLIDAKTLSDLEAIALNITSFENNAT